MILSKQAQEIIFSCKIEKPNHTVSIANNIAANQTPHHKDHKDRRTCPQTQLSWGSGDDNGKILRKILDPTTAKHRQTSD